MEITVKTVEKVQRQWQGYAGDEAIKVENVSGTFYGFGSELAVLRIYAAYRCAKNVRFGFSENLQTWFVSLEPLY